MAQSDYFLKIDGIDGESTDDSHAGEIEISSFSWGVTNSGTFGSGGGGGAGKCSFQDLHFTAVVSKASPNLMAACATGEHIESAVITLRKAGGDQEEYETITLTDVLVSSYQQGGSDGSDARPIDQFSLNFGVIDFSYSPQKPDGSLDSAVEAGYDVTKNKKT